MAVYTIEDTTLTAIADAIRNKKNEVLAQNVVMTNNLTPKTLVATENTNYQIIITPTEVINNGRGRIQVNVENTYWYAGKDITNGEYIEYEVGVPVILKFSGIQGGAMRFLNIVDGYGATSNKPYLSADISVIEINDNGENKYLYQPTKMADEINKLIVISPDKKVLTGDISNGLRAPSFNWFWNDGSVSTKDLTGASSCFYNQYYISDIPIVFNFKEGVTAQISSMFYNCKALKELPEINNIRPDNIQQIFYYCENLRSIPEDYMDTWDMEEIQTDQYAYLKSMFQYCHRLRTIPTKILSKLWGPQTYYYGLYYQGFYECHSLDELVGMEVGTGNFNSNAFGSCLYHNYHLKDFIFATNEDGSAKTANWKSQTISFVNGTTGYGNLLSWGFTEDTRIIDDESYQLLKDNPDAWTSLVEYSRYNHDSAVRTINSLPDTSAYGTNTIKFKGESGSATDGGAINTLTEEEIAVATAKGWTVSLV